MTTPKTWEEVEKPLALALLQADGRYVGEKAALWDEHWDWYLRGRDDPDSCVQYSSLAHGVALAAVVVRALRAAGLAVVPQRITPAIAEAITQAPASSGPFVLPHTALWSTALSAGELAPPDKGEG